MGQKTCLWVPIYTIGGTTKVIENLKILQEIYIFRFVEYTKHAHTLGLLYLLISGQIIVLHTYKKHTAPRHIYCHVIRVNSQ